jgi:hypothetical protein
MICQNLYKNIKKMRSGKDYTGFSMFVISWTY